MPAAGFRCPAQHKLTARVLAREPEPIKDNGEKQMKDQPKVVAIGPGERDKDGDLMCVDTVEVGDTVLFTAYAGSDVKVGDQEYLVLNVCDVLAVVED